MPRYDEMAVVDEKELMLALLGTAATLTTFSLVLLGIWAVLVAPIYEQRAVGSPRLWIAAGLALLFAMSLLSMTASFVWLLARLGTPPGSDPTHDVFAAIALPVAIASFLVMVTVFLYLAIAVVWAGVTDAWEAIRDNFVRTYRRKKM
jgi:hypothetical protein